MLATLGACGGGGGDEAANEDGAVTTTAPTTTTTPSTTTTTTEPVKDLPSADDSGKSELPDGRHFGYWKTFEIGDTIAFGEFDLASFLTGKEAEAAAAKKGDEVPNDYYIVNDNPKLRTVLAKGNAEVLVLADDRGPDPQKSNVADFAVDRHKDAGFWITIKDGFVTKIEEQYQP
jgi:hypothetical protein